MKKLIPLIFLFLGCTNPSDCVKSTGVMTSKEIAATPFEKIIIHRGIGLVITQGSEYKVEIRTGVNLINDIDATISGTTLTLNDNTTCNWVRDYGQTTVFVTAPNLTEIYSKTDQTITSNGVLTFPNIHLIAIDNFDKSGDSGTGDFILEINTTNLSLENNYVANFTISGQTQNLNIAVYEGNGIMNAENLIAKKINIYHRGSNNAIVHPVDELSGDIYNVGNVICVTKPAVVKVTEHYRGKLIFR
jgi:Putative auto-transporter adhesin, head GIN domain